MWCFNQEREAITLVYVDGTQGWASVADNTEGKINKSYVAQQVEQLQLGILKYIHLQVMDVFK